MGQALNAIIARGFNLYPLQGGASFRAGRDNRRITDSNLESADVNRRVAEFNLGQAKLGAEDKAAVSELIPELMGIPDEAARIAEGQAIAYDNFQKSMARRPLEQAPSDDFVGPMPSRVDPDLEQRAMEMLMQPSIELNERQNQIISELIQRSPALQELMLQRQFGSNREWQQIPADDPRLQGMPTNRMYMENTQTGEVKSVGSGGNTNVTVNQQDQLEDQLLTTRLKQYTDEGVKITEAVDAARANLPNIQQFRRLNSQVQTGAFTDKLLGLDKALTALGMPDALDMNIGALEAMKGVSLEFAMQRVQQTKGAISNKEMELFENAAPNMNNTPEGNAMLLDFAERAANRQIEVSRLYNAFERTLRPEDYGRAMQLWQEELDAYHEANPFFTEAEMNAIYGASELLADFGPAAEGTPEGEIRKNAAGTMIQATRNDKGELRWLKVQ